MCKAVPAPAPAAIAANTSLMMSIMTLLQSIFIVKPFCTRQGFLPALVLHVIRNRPLP